MPYAIKEAATGQLLACSQVNGYQLPYFGVLLFEAAPGDDAIREALVRTGGNGEAGIWQPFELTEHQAKMANVKLRNDPRRMVFWREEKWVVDVIEQPQ